MTNESTFCGRQVGVGHQTFQLSVNLPKCFCQSGWDIGCGDQVGLGWHDFQAQKYRAWEHHFALTALAVWFIAQTKLECRQTYTRDRELARRLDVEFLPALYTANDRELLKAVLPLPVFTQEQATQLVITRLVQRARSAASRQRPQNPGIISNLTLSTK